MRLRKWPLKVAMVTPLMRTVSRPALEPRRFPRTATGRVMGWGDAAVQFSLEPPQNAVVPLFL